MYQSNLKFLTSNLIFDFNSCYLNFLKIAFNNFMPNIKISSNTVTS